MFVLVNLKSIIVPIVTGCSIVVKFVGVMIASNSAILMFVCFKSCVMTFAFDPTFYDVIGFPAAVCFFVAPFIFKSDFVFSSTSQGVFPAKWVEIMVFKCSDVFPLHDNACLVVIFIVTIGSYVSPCTCVVFVERVTFYSARLSDDLCSLCPLEGLETII